MALVGWQPTVDDVGSILRARTKDVHGNELGTFNHETRPTGSQVQQIINAITPSYELMLPETPEPAVTKTARHLAALHAAIHVETSFFPEQVETGRSPVNLLRETYDTERDALMGHLSGTVEGGASVAPSPEYSFSVPLVTDPHIVGWRTPW